MSAQNRLATARKAAAASLPERPADRALYFLTAD
jgi:hypothetical protein